MNINRIIAWVILWLILMMIGLAVNGIHVNTYEYVEGIFLEENNDDLIYTCKYPLAKIAKAFAVVESNECRAWLSLKTKNCWSLHHWGRFYNRRDGKSYLRNSEPLRIYTRQTAAMYDFMYLYYYWYGCNISIKHSLYYIYGSWPYSDEQHKFASIYTSNLLRIMSK